MRFSYQIWLSTYFNNRKPGRSSLVIYYKVPFKPLPRSMFCQHILTLPMLRLISSKYKEADLFENPSKPCRVGIHW